MKYFFLAIAVLALWGCFSGNLHLLGIIGISLVMAAVIHFDEKKSKDKDTIE